MTNKQELKLLYQGYRDGKIMERARILEIIDELSFWRGSEEIIDKEELKKEINK